MKSYLIIVPISTLLVLQTVSGIPGFRYLRSSLNSIDTNDYRIRDTIPDFDGANALPSTNLGNDDAALKVTDRLRPNDASPGPVRPQQPIRGNTKTAEEIPTSNNMDFDDEPIYASENPALSNDLGRTDEVPPQRLPNPKRRGDGSPYTNSQPLAESDQVPQNQVSQPVLSRVKQFAGLTTVLANIARIPQAVALKIDSVMAGLQSTYPSNTNVGAYMMGTRFLLRNQGALRPFDLMDRAGIGRLDELVSSMPSLFNPIFSYIERIMAAIARKSMMMLQRFGETARRVTERARSSLSGINVARNNDSYSFSVPNLIDMVLRGKLANAVDEVVGYAQRGIQASLSRVGSAFSSGIPVPTGVIPTEDEGPVRKPQYEDEGPVRKPQYEDEGPVRKPQMRNSRLSHLSDYYRAPRYYRN